MTEAEQKKRSSLEKYHLKQRIRELANKRSHIQSTTLVTLYIPPSTRLSDIQQKLNEEAGTAVNIKDKNTGKVRLHRPDVIWPGFPCIYHMDADKNMTVCRMNATKS